MITSNHMFSFLIDSYKNSSLSCCKVIGNSMFPLIRKGDWITIEPITGNKLKSGDIILFHAHQILIVHRIVNIADDQLVTKGDWSRSLDLPISKNNVIGIVVAIKKGGKEWSLDHPFINIPNQIIRLVNQYYLNFTLRRII